MDLDWRQLITDKDFTLHRISTLLVLIIISSLTLMGVVFPFLKNYLQQWYFLLGIWIIIEGIIVLYWYYNRAIFPKGDVNKKNLIVAITTEDSKQKTRIAKDFTNEIRKQLKINNLDEFYEVLVLHNHLAKTAQKKIDLWYQSKKANFIESEDLQNFNSMAKKMNATFFVYGDLIKRNASNSTYCLSIEALILHNPADQEKSQTLHKEFSELWKKEITFLEEDELNGFKSNAEHIFFTATYMLGLATFVNNKFEHGINIWERLEKYILGKSELKSFQPKVAQLKAISFLLQSRLLFFEGNIKLSIEFRNKYLEITPNEYDQYLNEAVNQVNLRNDPELALEYIDRAEKIAKGDGTWRYNKLYLLIKLNRMNEAIRVLEQIFSHKYQNEIDTIQQVITYNENCLKKDKNHIQTYFIVGSLFYKKLKHPVYAYEKLEEFIKKTDTNNSWDILREKAKFYLKEIDEIIGVNKDD